MASLWIFALLMLSAVASAAPTLPEQHVVDWMLKQDFGYCPPTQIHISYAGDASSLTVTWWTSLPTIDPVVVVQYDDDDEQTFPADIKTYLPSAGFIYNATFTGLSPNQEFHYYVGSQKNGWSDSHHFYAPPALGERERTTTFVSIGDMGIFQYAMPTVQAVSKLADNNLVDFILNAGDYGYGDDRSACYYEESWNLYFDQNAYIMQHVPHMGCPGNHEKSCGSDECKPYSDDFQVYIDRFTPPAAASNSTTNMWYSFQVANIHMVALDTETDYPNSFDGDMFGDQLAWLRADLVAARADDSVDWIIAFGHRPWYASTYRITVDGHPHDGYEATQAAFEPLFDEFGVDLYFDGHVHAYERIFPTFNNTMVGTNTAHQYVNPPSTSYIVNGNAGNIEGFQDDWSIIRPAWSAFRYHEEHGYGIMEVTGDSKLTWSYWRSRDNGLIDFMELVKTDDPDHVSEPVPPIHPLLR